MLSYQHGFHAGNFADVLKHMVLANTLEYLTQKDKPLYFLDTHAGRGWYSLTHPTALKTAEFEKGIAKLWGAKDAPKPVADYLALIKSFNRGPELRYYPGSSLQAAKLLREQDRVHGCELHPQEAEAFAENAYDYGIRAFAEDGLAHLKATLPPLERRGCVLIDPSYEREQEDYDVINAVGDALKRFATGTYLIWYPIVNKTRAEQFCKRMGKLPVKSLLQAELYEREPTGDLGGMAGTGMLIINGPWNLQAQLAESLPYLQEKLFPETGRFALNWLVQAP